MAELVPYSERDRGAVEEFLKDPPGAHVYLASRLDGPGRGEGLLQRENGRLRGFAWFGTGMNLLFKSDSPAFLAALAREAVRREGRWLMVVGAWRPVSEFLDRYRKRSTRRPRLDRVQELYVQTPEALPPLREPHLCPAGEEDVEELAAAAAHMSAEDFEIEPWRIDQRAVRRSVLQKVREHRSWLLREGGRIVFKADLAARRSEGGQVEGVFTVEDCRCRGIASRCVCELGHRLLPGLPLLSLHVAEANRPARRAYENAGYRHAGRLRLAIFPRA